MSVMSTTLRLFSGLIGPMRWLFPAGMLTALAICWLLPTGGTRAALSIIASLTGTFWLVIGSRLLSLTFAARSARLPGLLPQTSRQILLALTSGIVLPIALLNACGADPELGPAIVLAAAALGFFLAAAPVSWWIGLSFLMGVASGLLRQLGNLFRLSASTSPWLILAAALLLACAVLAYRRARWQHGEPKSVWSNTLWLGVETNRRTRLGSLENTTAEQEGRWAWVYGIARPGLSVDMKHQPELALGYAIGPGFAPGAAISGTVATIAMPTLLLLMYSSPLLNGGNGVLVALIGYNIVMPLVSLKLLQRLWLLRWRSQGEAGTLSLLPTPRLASHASEVVSDLLTKRCIAAWLPWFAMTTLAGLIGHAPADYFLLLVIAGSNVALSSASILLCCMRSRRLTLALCFAHLMLIPALIYSLLLVFSTADHHTPWLIPAWSVGLLVTTSLHTLMRKRLAQQPHPWLLN